MKLSVSTTILLIIFFKYQICELCRDPQDFHKITETFQTETHTVTTQDGYNLTLFRVRSKVSQKPLIKDLLLQNLNYEKELQSKKGAFQ